MELGQTKTCTITNDDTGLLDGKIVVEKYVINTDGGTAKAEDFTLFVTGNNPSSTSFQGSEDGVEVILSAGQYSITEGFKPGPI